MKILFDQGTPLPLREYFTHHVIDTADELSWARLKNGELLTAAEENGYQLLVTTDQNLKYQQKLSGRKFSVLVLLSTSWPRLKNHGDEIAQMADKMEPGTYAEFDPK